MGNLDDTAWNGLRFLFEKPSLVPKPPTDTGDLIEPANFGAINEADPIQV
jgi:hypothetical protein